MDYRSIQRSAKLRTLNHKGHEGTPRMSRTVGVFGLRCPLWFVVCLPECSLQAKRVRQQTLQRALFYAVAAFVPDDGFGAEFRDHLAAGAAGRARDIVVVRHGDRFRSEERRVG